MSLGSRKVGIPFACLFARTRHRQPVDRTPTPLRGAGIQKTSTWVRNPRPVSQHINRRKLRLAADAVPQIDRETRIAGPERVAPPTEGGASSPDLIYCCHGECPRSLQPDRFTGPLIKLEEGVAVTSGPMAQVRPFGERPSVPGQFAPSLKQALNSGVVKGASANVVTIPAAPWQCWQSAGG